MNISNLKIKKEKHSSWRFVLFATMILLILFVVFLLSSGLRVKFIDLKYRFSYFVNGIEENFYTKKYTTENISAPETQTTIPVLLYHGVGKNEGLYSVTKKEFRNQMTELKNAGFQTIDDVAFGQFMRGEKEIPEKSFLLTFDDGQKSSYYNTDPILKKLGFTATMFIATGKSLSKEALYSSYYLNENEVKRMIDSGRWNIGSHAVQAVSGMIPIDDKGSEGYFLSNRMWLNKEKRLETEEEYKNRINYELTESKNKISKLTGKKDILFSYPFSDYGENSINAVKIAANTINEYVAKNYNYAFRQLFGTDKGFIGNNSSNNSYLLKRVEIKKDFDTNKLVQVLTSSTTLPLEQKTFDARNFSQILYRWHIIWGNNFILKDNLLSMFIDQERPNTISVLDGTRNWKNYEFKVKIPSFPSDTVGLYARMNESEYSGVRCLWLNNTVVIEELKNKENSSKIIFSSNIKTGESANIGISVKDNLVACYENDKIIATAKLKNTDEAGGLGIQFGLNSSSSSNLTIDSFSIDNSKLTIGDVSLLENLSTKSLVQKVSNKILEGYISKSFETEPRFDSGKSLITNDVNFYKKETYKDIVAKFSNTESSFTTDVSYSTDGTAYWTWPEVPVKDNQEYLIDASYSSSTQSELMAKFTMLDGSTTLWPLLKILPESIAPKNYQIMVHVPVGSQKMELVQLLRKPGILTIYSPKVLLLKDGSFDSGMISFNFDDGRKTFIDNAMPLLAKYKFPATLAIITSHTGFSNYMNPEDLKKAKDIGHEIAVHTRDHVFFNSNTPYVEILNQIIGSWYDLRQAGFDATTFVYPYGNSQDTLKPIIKKRFIGARSTYRGFNSKNTDPYVLKNQLVDRNTTPEKLKSWIEEAEKNKLWLILELHNVNKENIPTDVEGITTNQLSTILTIVKQSGLPVVTLNDGLVLLRKK